MNPPNKHGLQALKAAVAQREERKKIKVGISREPITDVRTRQLKIFYCTAYEYVDRFGRAKADMEFTHASDAAEALATFWAGHPEMVGRCKIVGVAPAVGFKVVDDHGERLIA